MSANDHPCDGCKYFKWIPEMGAHLPWCRLDRKFDPVKCDRFELRMQGGGQMSELLPCPFCKGKAYTIKPARYGKSWGVLCECGAFLGYYDTEAEAIAAWNRRAEQTCKITATATKDGETISMLGSQADELRKAAAAMEELGREIGKPYGMSRGLIRTAQMMREAADTIESLREKAQAATLGSEECAQCAKDMGAYADSLCDPLKERINKLLHCLENDWHISASWDGLRKFWCIELTEEGVRLRDRSQELQGVGGESHYHELFGTPERAAWTLAKACGECDENLPCRECPLSPIVGNNVYEPELLEWLRGDAE